MKTLFVMLDTLNRSALGCYGATDIDTPNFDRFAGKSVKFDNHYVGSMPCMPARRDLHTGRLNFMHRSWGPLEPFDESMIRSLKQSGCWTHIITDHAHYWMEGGSTYHTQYSSFDLIRGQDKDRWKPMPEPDLDYFKAKYHPCQFNGNDEKYMPYMISREHQPQESDMPLAKGISAALEFLESHGHKDNWFLQLELFDPHEPFWSPDRFASKRDSGYEGPILDWPPYDRVGETPEEVAELRNNYAGLVEMCDEYLGRLLDHMDAHDMWKDTIVVVGTDHGLLMGEHAWWGKNLAPFYNEIAHIPLMIYHPDHAEQAGTSRKALTQTIDLMPTVLGWYGLDVPASVMGQDLTPLLAQDGAGHEVVAYGVFGGAVNVTDGDFTYFLYPEDVHNQEIYEYTLMPTHIKSFFGREQLAAAELTGPMDFAGGLPVLKVPASKTGGGEVLVPGMGVAKDAVTALYDIRSDPEQTTPLHDPDTATRLKDALTRLMVRNQAPTEAFGRIGLTAP